VGSGWSAATSAPVERPPIRGLVCTRTCRSCISAPRKWYAGYQTKSRGVAQPMSIRTGIVDLTRCTRIQAGLLGAPAFGANVATSSAPRRASPEMGMKLTVDRARCACHGQCATPWPRNCSPTTAWASASLCERRSRRQIVSWHSGRSGVALRMRSASRPHRRTSPCWVADPVPSSQGRQPQGRVVRDRPFIETQRAEWQGCEGSDPLDVTRQLAESRKVSCNGI
jgi:hypothetical protein